MRRPRFQELLFAVNERIYIGGSQFDVVAVRDRIRRTRFYAIAAKNTSRVIDVVNLCVTLACRDAVGIGIFRSFDVNAVRRTRRRAQKASNAFFKAIFVPLQNVDSAITRLHARRHVRIGLRGGLTKHGAQGHAEALVERDKRLTHFFHDGWHRIDFSRLLYDRQFGAAPSL